jgi:hypothetical protein
MILITHVYRALYSLIQFTTITLLYSFASSLGDFQVSIFVHITKAKGGTNRIGSSYTLTYLS